MKNKILKIFVITAIIIGILWTIKILSYTYIKIEFTELRPFHSRASVYLNGFKIGHVVKIEPSEDYSKTIVITALYPLKIKLPINTTAKLKMHKTKWLHKDYIDLIYPSEPELTYIKNGSTIKGTSSINIDSYFASISYDTYEKLESDMENIIENLNGSTGLLLSIFSIIDNILNESQTGIKTTFNNLSTTTTNTSQITQKVNNVINEEDFAATISNIHELTDNTKKLTMGLNGTTSQINQTLPNVSNMLTTTNCILNNVNDITCGVKNTMKKRLSGLRLLFGKVIN